MRVRPAMKAMRAKRQIQAVSRQGRASHTAATSLVLSMARVIATTAIGAPGKKTTMPLIEKNAAAPTSVTAAVYASTSIAVM
jgi:hypothetical protein